MMTTVVRSVSTDGGTLPYQSLACVQATRNHAKTIASGRPAGADVTARRAFTIARVTNLSGLPIMRPLTRRSRTRGNQMSQDANIDAYFERISFSGSIAPSLATLEQL